MGGAFLVASWQSRDDCPSMAKIISQNSNSPRLLPRAGHFVDTCVGVNEIYACQQPTLGERSDTTTHTQDVHPQLDLQQLRVTELVQVVGLETAWIHAKTSSGSASCEKVPPPLRRLCPKTRSSMKARAGVDMVSPKTRSRCDRSFPRSFLRFYFCSFDPVFFLPSCSN